MTRSCRLRKSGNRLCGFSRSLAFLNACMQVDSSWNKPTNKRVKYEDRISSRGVSRAGREWEFVTRKLERVSSLTSRGTLRVSLAEKYTTCKGQSCCLHITRQEKRTDETRVCFLFFCFGLLVWQNDSRRCED